MKLVFLLIVLTSPLSAQKLDAGFYLTQEKTANCERTVKLSPKKKDFLCLTPKPIIATDQFLAISDIKVDEAAGISYADLTITEKAVQVLKALSSSFRGSTMVLILNEQLAGILNYSQSPIIRDNQIRISVNQSTGDMFDVHSQIKAIVEENRSRQ